MKTTLIAGLMAAVLSGGLLFAEDAGPTEESRTDGKPGNSVSDERNKGQQGEKMREKNRERREKRREERAEKRKERDEKRAERRRAKKGND